MELKIIQSTGFRPFDKSVNIISLNPSQLVMAIAGNNGTGDDSIQIWERKNVQGMTDSLLCYQYFHYS